MFLAQPSVDLPLHDTYFVVAHFHLIMGVAAIFGIFAATYFWFPKMFGKFLNETVGKIHFWLTFAGVYCIFMPMHFLGIAGHMRRYSDLSGVPYLSGLMGVQYFISIAAFITIGAQLLFLGNFIAGLWGGKKAGVNPWNATTLEWTIPSPPPHDNFAGVIPTVYRGAYEFSVPGEAQDFILQSALPSKLNGITAKEGIRAWYCCRRTRPSRERGFGGGNPPRGNAGGGDDGRGGGRSIPRRAYITGITLAVAAIMMFFMALTSSYIVRKGTGTDWQAFGMPRVLWANTVILLLSSLTLEMARRQLARGVMSAFRNLWALTTGLGLAFCWRTTRGVASTARGGRLFEHESEQQFLLCFYGRARCARAGRNFRVAVRGVSIVATFANDASDWRGSGRDLLAFFGRALGFPALTSLVGTVNCA